MQGYRGDTKKGYYVVILLVKTIKIYLIKKKDTMIKDYIVSLLRRHAYRHLPLILYIWYMEKSKTA